MYFSIRSMFVTMIIYREEAMAKTNKMQNSERNLWKLKSGQTGK